MPDLRLRPMTAAEFTAFARRAAREYAETQAAAGNWDPAQADALAQRSFAQLLPGGADTDGVLLCVAELADGTEVGLVWVALQGAGPGEAWIYDIEVTAEQRGQGYGRALLAATEQAVSAHGIERLGLNVFGDNAAARSLYESAGYETVTVQMRKSLGP